MWIKVSPKPNFWIFSAIYASPDLETRKLLWNELNSLTRTHSMDWLLGGDFNVLSAH